MFIRLLAATLLLALLSEARSSDHLDTAAVIADTSADIGDLYAWASADGRRLNLVMTIVGKKFSDHVRYAFHIDSAQNVGGAGETVTVVCEFNSPTAADCSLGDVDHLRGEASGAQGIRGVNGRFRVFAGLRDDPFFNNVEGTRAALDVAKGALSSGAGRTTGGCPHFDEATVARIHDEWRRTAGAGGKNFLAGWPTAALVVEVDLNAVNRAGPLLGIWATTSVRGVTPGHPLKLDDGVPIDRMGRALTGNMLLATFDADDTSAALKSRYNQAPPEEWQIFAPELARNLAIYDAFDGRCGNQWLAVQNFPPALRYHALAQLLADDRLWVNSRSRSCRQYLAAEFDFVGDANTDCGGRAPSFDAVDVFRSLLSHGEVRGLPDGVDHDDGQHSDREFPFLGPSQLAPAR